MSWASWRLRPGVDLTGHEVAADRLERRGPATPAQFVALAQRLEPLVVADRMAVVLGHVAAQVDAETRQVEAVGPPVVIDREVADRAARQLGVGARRLAVRQPAAAAERRVVAGGGGAALEAAGRDHRRDSVAAARPDDHPTIGAPGRDPWGFPRSDRRLAHRVVELTPDPFSGASQRLAAERRGARQASDQPSPR